MPGIRLCIPAYKDTEREIEEFYNNRTVMTAIKKKTILILL